MMKKIEIEKKHPLRKLFRKALDFGLKLNPLDNTEATTDYIEEHILCDFIHVDNLYKIRDINGRKIEDIADMLEEGNVLLNAQSFNREFDVHKHIGDYTLFMLSMFPSALTRKKGKEFILGSLVIPDSSLSEHYMLQGQRSYRIASKFIHKELFEELSSNFSIYKNVLELVRIYLESVGSVDYLKAKEIIEGTA